jgi:hypothetical protein
VAPHRVAYTGEVGPDALCGVGLGRDRLLDFLRRGVEEVSGDGLDQLVFGAREAIEGGLRAAEPLGQLVMVIEVNPSASTMSLAWTRSSCMRAVSTVRRRGLLRAGRPRGAEIVMDSSLA